MSSIEFLRELYEEYLDWYLSIAEENGVLPRSISGVDADGKQFIYLIDGLTLQPMARNKYLRYVLDEHQSVAYAYGGLALRGDSDLGQIEEVLDVVAADANQYVMGHWQVIRGEGNKVTSLRPMGVTEGTDPEKHPASWYLAGAIRFTDKEKEKYGTLWDEAQPSVMFNDRNAAE
ncbi:conserved hypothetical protein [Chlorobaculum parvum NCIB 8327]|uniref:Uncharacterized protein n=1 Tax=Chlorobaculum parvum (strain DSM 263 / NCIMB 8327) TaxID=517417 RepID=B3QN72_CHLP8|nr:hypothetical protein [Chlorobaculum parvum]ACF11375.1 conserved hypothetical protein [Chlorobaculum parvum NCIB 8327]